MWPKQKAKISVLVTHIERHTTSLRDEVSYQHIREEHEARAKALAHFDQETAHQDLQKFQALRGRIAPQVYDDRLDWLLNRLSEGSTGWLMRDKVFLDWLDISNSAARLLWLRGIPGAGKCLFITQISGQPDGMCVMTMLYREDISLRGNNPGSSRTSSHAVCIPQPNQPQQRYSQIDSAVLALPAGGRCKRYTTRGK